RSAPIPIRSSQKLRLPKLRRARLSKFVKRADADHRLGLLRRGHDAAIKVIHRNEGAPPAFLEDSVARALGQTLHADQWNTDRLMADGKRRARLIDGRWQQRDAEAMTFQHINERVIKAFAV